MKSITVAQLIAELEKQPKSWQVFTSSDPEGNGYGRLDKDFLTGGSNEDKVLILYPIEMHQYEEICPIESKKIDEEIKAELGK